MKQKVTINRAICDLCGSKECYDTCLKCGKDICFECQRNGKAVEYPHAVHFSGSGDGTYCSKCNDDLIKRPDKLFLAYRAILNLRNESKLFYDDHSKRAEAAEKHLKSLQDKE
jgi:hypothetical protein